MCIQNNGYDRLAPGYQSYLNGCLKNLFCQAYYFNFQPNQDSFFACRPNLKNAKHLKNDKWRINANSVTS